MPQVSSHVERFARWERIGAGAHGASPVDRRAALAYVPGFVVAGHLALALFGMCRLFPFLLIVHALIAAALVTVILMQRSEGGGLGMGGSPSGLMSARGAADFLTRATTVLAGLFIGLSILLAMLAATHRGSISTIDTSLARTRPAAPQAAPTTAPGAATPADNSAIPLAR